MALCVDVVAGACETALVVCLVSADDVEIAALVNELLLVWLTALLALAWLVKLALEVTADVVTCWTALVVEWLVAWLEAGAVVALTAKEAAWLGCAWLASLVVGKTALVVFVVVCLALISLVLLSY